MKWLRLTTLAIFLLSIPQILSFPQFLTSINPIFLCALQNLLG
ncbi:hypothetical protein VCRA2123O444_20421 [Vibrio crassostreae]|nr:hypothetical protein VCRA2118O429_10005 [Vibrio crassostreae]CAK1891477.1 hypothetical protein VCRA2110O182_10759 [Vibrio crassostreae]CAK1958387.1 hypothetical protein VCRA2113O416_20005 [Vibrio crassostreae]CAK1964607.1 hypothetical protein VCRA2117O428_20005 [Vibrio crassostreae]CAK1966313.1 hypothetical protein VCRA2119O430_20005 [Vibrio crassostreae]